MLKTFTILVLTGLLSGGAIAEDYADCFVPGEVVEYKIYWLGIPIAWSRTTTDVITEEGRDLIRITMVAQTYSAYKHIFEVDDKTEVVIDPETALPVSHDWIINEGSIQKSHRTTFHHDKQTAIFQDRISKDIREVEIEPDTREIFSFIYANRNRDLQALAEGKHRLLVTGKMYDLELQLKDENTVKVPDYGRMPSIEIEPIADFDGIFLRRGKVFFWISKEKSRVITSIKAKVAVGNITAKLQTFTGGDQGFWNRKK